MGSRVKPTPPKPTRGERLLDETYTAVREFLAVTPAQATAITLYAAATHAIKAFPAFPRIFFGANTPESGKTAAMLVTAYLSSNPVDAAGSSYALTSRLAQAHNSPEQPSPTLYRDEISDVYGKAGLNTASKDPISDVLRRGYKRGATTSWSVNRVAEDINIYLPVILAGLGTALPTDIRSRCVVITMKRGRPELDLDSDGSEDRLRAIGSALGAEVRAHIPAMVGFTCEGIAPKLTGRAHQVWRPLIAIATFLGGASTKWRKRALSAFGELTGAAASVCLSADQQTLKDLVEIISDLEIPTTPAAFVGGHALAEELLTYERFEGRTPLSVAKDIARAMPIDSEQKRVPHQGIIRGYYVKDILQAWEDAKPADPEEMAAKEEIDPFAVR
jgi:hypothetical protein